MKTALTIFFLLTFVSHITAQRTVYGRLYHVVDGKTAVLETESHNYLTVKLQFIEVPSASETMASVVTDHLEQLLAGKSLQFQVRGMSEFSMLSGVLTANGVDISQQMLRDGAAWYSLPEKDNQNAGEREIYLKIEATAKDEKRGVWGVKDLKPSWEINLAKQNAESAANPQLSQKDSFSSKTPAKQSPCQTPANSTELAASANVARQDCDETFASGKKPSAGDIVCDGAPVPPGFSLTKQIVSADCVGANRDGKAFIIQPSDDQNRSVVSNVADTKAANAPSAAKDAGTLPETQENKTVYGRKN